MDNSNSAEKALELIGQLVAFVIVLNFQAWLARFCMGFLVPEFSLEFWQWLVTVFTIRWIVNA